MRTKRAEKAVDRAREALGKYGKGEGGIKQLLVDLAYLGDFEGWDLEEMAMQAMEVWEQLQL